jgi:hypothetical protein
VKAPVSGSVILAGVLFKPGGCGLLHVFPIWSKYVFGFGSQKEDLIPPTVNLTSMW